mgnify:CR=1 FL=1
MNRWGEEIFTFSPTQLKWDGINKKTRLPVQDGTYTWKIEFKTSMKNGDTESMFIALNRTLNIRDNMHNKKECICYCN